MEDQTTVVLAGVAIVVFLITATIVWLRVRRRAHERGHQDPLPLIPVAGGRGGAPAPPHRPTAPYGHVSPLDRTSAPAGSPGAPVTNGRGDSLDRFAPPRVDVPSRAAAHAHATVPAAGGSAEVYEDPARGALAETAQPSDSAAGSAVDGALVRYWRPADGTLQFLPGRLEVISGRDAGQEIRFVRTPGPDGTCVTFGRAEGAPYRHIQLREPTVSRAHARMTLESGSSGSPVGRAGMMSARWRLENLSATNPVVVNGRPLGLNGGAGAGVELDDGDRIEMGEVVFRFHAK